MRFSCLDLPNMKLLNILQEHPLSYFIPDTNQKPFLCEVHCGQNVKRLLPSRLPLSLIRPLIKAIRKQMPEIWIALDVIWTRACPVEIGETLRELGLNKHWVIWTWRIIQSQTSLDLGHLRRRETFVNMPRIRKIFEHLTCFEIKSESHGRVERKYLV